MVAGDIERTDDNAFYKSRPTVVDTGRKQVIQANLPFRNAAELLDVCTRERLTIAQVVFENERRWRSDIEIKRGLMELWRTMDASITNGCWSTQTHLPGGLNVRRRAPQLFKRLMEKTLVRMRAATLLAPAVRPVSERSSPAALTRYARGRYLGPWALGRRGGVTREPPHPSPSHRWTPPGQRRRLRSSRARHASTVICRRWPSSTGCRALRSRSTRKTPVEAAS